ncbi:hypothetical protein GURKE_00230 [Brevundimonas phage vB_BpoS-Gurke]|uniref:Uncharacterized protein n=1 Tax=Brevundimonas phage vB_BpoS-Gurke TaxID=2948599 RepID=A0A9E7SSL3_9CAUD|nr:hypothetical protein GURKE_00230 [Brevundimonas phage vB_BpoS-Gurke]
MDAVAPPRYWHPKRPPSPFYAPDDYHGWGTPEEEEADLNRTIRRWRQVHAGLSLRDRIRHFFSHSGCFVVENL